MNNNINYKLLFDKQIEEIKKIDNKPKLLLHACCGPCSSHVLELLNKYFDITILYYNPNIYPKEEYSRRYNELLKFNKEAKYNLNIIEIPYNDKDYYDAIKDLEHLGEKSKRCYNCYQLRMNMAASYAKNNNYDYFTTTLSISPHKISKWINEIGEQLQTKYNIKYLYADFKKDNGYKRSLELSKEFNLYRQDYCGCKFSKENKDKLLVKRIITNELEENCYILEKDNCCLIIDPGKALDRILDSIKNKKLLKILITHKHFDHINCLYDIMKIYKVDCLSFDNINNGNYKIGPFIFDVIKTPGHSADSITYYFKNDKIMFTGDFLFKDTIGRCDLPTGNFEEMKDSLNKIIKYNKDITIYPGHGEKTTLEYELENNIYLKD